MENKDISLKNFLEIPYDELEKMNLQHIESAGKKSDKEIEKEVRDYLVKEKRIKAVTICFTNI